MSDVRPPRALARHQQVPGKLSIGDTATLDEGPELLKLLMRPYGPNSFPLGRGIHPMTTVPLGLAIDAAIEAAGGYALEVTTLRYCRFSMEAPTSNQRALRGSARITAIGNRHVETHAEVHELDRLILTAEIGLVRVRGGRAVELADRVSHVTPVADAG